MSVCIKDNIQNMNLVIGCTVDQTENLASTSAQDVFSGIRFAGM